MLLSVTTVGSVSAQGMRLIGLRVGMGQPISPVTLVGIGEIQKELALKDDQVAKLNTVSTDFRTEFISEVQSAGFDFGELQGLAQEERQKKLAEIRAKFSEIGKNLTDKFQPKLAEVLDAPQRERLNQLRLQASGSHSLKDADVVKALELSKEQQEKVDTIAKEAMKKSSDLFGQGGDREERANKLKDLGTDWDAKSGDVLTKEQKEKFDHMKGKPFDFSELRIGG
jgi:hypothetical protein